MQQQQGAMFGAEETTSLFSGTPQTVRVEKFGEKLPQKPKVKMESFCEELQGEAFRLVLLNADKKEMAQLQGAFVDFFSTFEEAQRRNRAGECPKGCEWAVREVEQKVQDG